MIQPDREKTEELRAIVPGQEWLVSVTPSFSDSCYALSINGLRGMLASEATWEQLIEVAKSYNSTFTTN